MKTFRMRIAVLSALLAAVLSLQAQGALAAQEMTRMPKEEPAILVAAFGTSTKAQSTYDVFERQLRGALPGLEVRWAFTSGIIREKMNAKWTKEGSPQRLLSVTEALGKLRDDGYAKVAVLPLQIAPGEEYEEILRLATGFPGLRIEFGETLLQRWENVHKVVELIARDFLAPGEGCNVVVAHGSPQTGVGSNTTYLGLDRYLSKRYANAYLGCVEGIVTREEALDAAKAHQGKKVRLIPLMYVAGDHVMNDLMAEDDGSEEPSWKAELERAGKTVDMPVVESEGTKQFLSLGLIPEINGIFIRDIEKAVKRF